MTDQLIDKLAERGVMGLMLAIALYVIYKLYGELKTSHNERTSQAEAFQRLRMEDAKAHQDQLEEVQNARIEDAKTCQAQFVELLKQSTIALTNSTNAAEAQREASGELKSAFDKFVEDNRRTNPRRS